MVDILQFRCIFASEISSQSATEVGNVEWDNKVRKEILINQTKTKKIMKAIFSKDVTSEVKECNHYGYTSDEYILDSRTTTIRLFGIKISEKKELFLHPYEKRE